jgi:L-ascorbate metabolism protein UlaG (beta-lactamase superfamily)
VRLRRLDDYQSWALESQGKRLLIDPWLTHEWSLPPGHWLFGRTREAPVGIEHYLPVDALILTGDFSDHLHKATLQHIPKALPAFAPRAAANALRKLGFENVTTLRNEEKGNPWPGLEIEAVASGFPYSHRALGYAFKEKDTTIYFEPHLIHLGRAKRLGPLDAVVAPVQSVRLMGLPFAMSAERAVQAARELKPKKWIPTGNEPQLGRGLFSTLFLFYRGSVDDFGALLASTGLFTQLAQLEIGEAFESTDFSSK